MDKRECIRKIREYFTDQDDVSTVYLFGSVVKDKTTKDSDVDIAVLFVQGLDVYKRQMKDRHYVIYNNTVSDIKEKIFQIFKHDDEIIQNEKVIDSSLCYEIIDEEDYLSMLDSIMFDTVSYTHL